MKSFKYFGLMLLALSVIFASCTKEVVGPQGPQGEPGAVGPAGPAGSNGQDGNANVSAFTYTAQPSDWFAFGTQGDAGYGFGVAFNIPAVTADITTGGTVLAYRVVSGNYIALPYSFPENGYTETYLYGYYTGGAQVERYDTDLATTPPTSAWDFKFVVIEGSARIANIDETNYNEVAAAYGLSME